MILDNSLTLKFSDENRDGVYTFTPLDGDYMGDAKQVRLLVKLGTNNTNHFQLLNVYRGLIQWLTRNFLFL